MRPALGAIGHRPMVEWFQEVWLELFPFRLGLEGWESRSIHDSWIIWTCIMTCIILRRMCFQPNRQPPNRFYSARVDVNLWISDWHLLGCEAEGDRRPPIGVICATARQKRKKPVRKLHPFPDKKPLWLFLKQFTYPVSCWDRCLEIFHFRPSICMELSTCDLLAEASVGLWKIKRTNAHK